MDNDDEPIGQVLTRREVLTLIGTAGVAALAGGPAPRAAHAARLPACIVRPQQTEGPYFVDRRLERTDVRIDPADGTARPGVRLDLEFRVSGVGRDGCQPLPGAMVDVWQCDAMGVYSDARDARLGFDTRGSAFLRGYQVTDTHGTARFTTIYPGWYPGRTVHIHFKVRVGPPGGRAREFTSQLYFDDALTDRVFASPPYAARGTRSTRNAADGIFRRGGDQLLLDVAPRGDGYAATFELGVEV